MLNRRSNINFGLIGWGEFMHKQGLTNAHIIGWFTFKAQPVCFQLGFCNNILYLYLILDIFYILDIYSKYSYWKQTSSCLFVDVYKIYVHYTSTDSLWFNHFNYLIYLSFVHCKHWVMLIPSCVWIIIMQFIFCTLDITADWNEYMYQFWSI